MNVKKRRGDNKGAGGRPIKNNYAENGFTLLKSETGKSKYCVICMVCQKILQNVAEQRLKGHRNICKLNNETYAEPNAANHHVQNIDNVAQEDVEEVEIITDSVVEYVVVNKNNINNEMEIEYVNESANNNPSSSTARPDSGISSSISNLNQIHIDSSRPSSSCSSTSKSLKRSHQNRPAKTEKNISSYIDTVSEHEISEITQSIANLFYGCNIPFNVIQSNLFHNFINKIRPAYVSQIPTRKKLATTLLDSSYEKSKIKSIAAVKKCSVLLIDGWKNSATNSKTVVCMLNDCVTEKRILLDAWDITCESETGDRLSEIVCKAIDIAKDTYNTTVYAAVSDNASNMVRMGKNLKHVLWHSTCNSHTANLLAKDVIDKSLTSEVSDVLKNFKQSDLERSILNKNGTKMKLACETRWCSYRDSYKCLINNLSQMRITAAENSSSNNSKIKDKTMKLIFDETFIKKVKDNLDIFEPICELINICQKSSTSIADAANLWLRLKIPDKFEIFYKNRLDMALSDYSLTALYLHPFYDSSLITSSKMSKVSNFLLHNLDSDGLDDWHKFRYKEGIFKVLYEKDFQNPITFWNTAEFYAKQLSIFARKLLSIPASSAEIERTFSKWNLIHSPLRNKLSFEKSKKLMYLYISLRLEDNFSLFDVENCDGDDDENQPE